MRDQNTAITIQETPQAHPEQSNPIIGTQQPNADGDRAVETRITIQDTPQPYPEQSNPTIGTQQAIIDWYRAHAAG